MFSRAYTARNHSTKGSARVPETLSELCQSPFGLWQRHYFHIKTQPGMQKTSSHRRSLVGTGRGSFPTPSRLDPQSVTVPEAVLLVGTSSEMALQPPIQAFPLQNHSGQLLWPPNSCRLSYEARDELPFVSSCFFHLLSTPWMCFRGHTLLCQSSARVY